MKVKFWGVRGSISAPGPDTVRYGGNTTCIEVRTAEDDLIVLDGGTGIFPLAQSLLKSLPVTAHIFITHSHWDHIQGLPFFLPIFIPGNKIFLYAAFDPITGAGPERIMNVQMQYSFFPVREAEMKSRIEYVVAMPHETISVGEARVTPFMLNHPVVNLGYRVESNGKSLFFTGDHEPYANIYAPGDEGHEEYSRLIKEQHASLVEAVRGVDVLISDSAYTVEEFPAKKGWGHGTFDGSIELAIAAGVKVLYCTHHEPTRSDDDLERAFAAALERYSGLLNGLDVRLAREGEELEF
ncbi:MAG: MBL fold metallo-hydrolase [Gallionellales bacterium GWA2_60_142]|jgi:phosphoribosyl 1,2-cyclic phosphodiesterase|nr:MAG: MBL fold metallo-hydrolase [Gallionellales bacterium GWA2_60_142]HCI13233.1 MBL fold metallo-hydrolase [Gallionellaceae bacterium]